MSEQLKPTPEGGWWLLIKRDLYERPGHIGYTGIRDEAGRYSKAEADQHAEYYGADCVVRLEDAPEFRNAAFPELVQAHLIKQREDRDATIVALSAEVERLRGERDANHNLAIANGSRAKEEEARAEAAEAEVKKLKIDLSLSMHREENAWTRANAAESKVSAWESVVCVVGGPMRVSPNIGWGPGSDERVSVPAITPERLTNILDKLADASSRAEAAEARVAELISERDKARRYCSVSAYDMAGFAETLKANPDAFPRTTHDLMETSEFMLLAAEGREDGTVYDDELSKEKARVKVMEEALHFYSEFSDHGEIAHAALSRAKEA